VSGSTTPLRSPGRWGRPRSEPSRSSIADRPWAIGSRTAAGAWPTSRTTSPPSPSTLSTADPGWVSGFAVAVGADVLIHDCQYTEEEYPDRAGFGHSSTQYVAEFARLAAARRLLLFHHDPNHTDDQLESLCDRVRELWTDGSVDLARRGDEVDFG
jgi:hypothetical protein